MMHEVEFVPKTIETFFKKIIFNFLFSALALLSFYMKLRLMAPEALETKQILFTLACEVFLCFFSAIYICVIAKKFPVSLLRLSLSALIWSVLFFGKDMAVFYVGKSFIESRGLLFAISGVLFALLFALLLLSLCKSIYDCNGRFLFAERKNLISFFRRFFWCMVGVLGLSAFLFSLVNPAPARSGGVSYVPTEVTEKWEPRLLAIALFLFFPFFTTSFVQIGQDIAEKQKQKEEQ